MRDMVGVYKPALGVSPWQAADICRHMADICRIRCHKKEAAYGLPP